jgi:ketosteroid isomerase-like protein
LPGHETLFEDIDSMDPDRYARHLSEDVVLRFGNGEPVVGRAAVRDAWAAFCANLHGVSHDLVERWEVGPATIVEAHVTYTRADESTVTVSVATIYRSTGALIGDYRIFIDLAPLFTRPT